MLAALIFDDQQPCARQRRVAELRTANAHLFEWKQRSVQIYQQQPMFTVKKSSKKVFQTHAANFAVEPLIEKRGD